MRPPGGGRAHARAASGPGKKRLRHTLNASEYNNLFVEISTAKGHTWHKMARNITTESVKMRFFAEAFSRPLIDNTLRGLWCEFMIAEALGPECASTGFSWYPWDLQIGDGRTTFPERIRIQVKNSASLQSWNQANGQKTDPLFSLTWRKKPYYFERDDPGIPCETEGFLCDLFILCHHPVTDIGTADQRDPGQWDFYLLPVHGPNSAVTQAELQWAQQKLRETGRNSSTQRRPSTLRSGIRGRQPCEPVGISDLTIDRIRATFGTR
ncbi:MAG: hypothetical protein HLUCCO07_16040 [Rhodobacteraceae bacterium HLUCCO07]|nr:MAG: hypothetical protein HLUCCO07_16040 [Rhodobacteraceae bacterium HLUCCO07]